MRLDLLAIAAHPDDVELSCGGTLLKDGAAGLQDRDSRLDRGGDGHAGNAAKRERKKPRRRRNFAGVVARRARSAGFGCAGEPRRIKLLAGGKFASCGRRR